MKKIFLVLIALLFLLLPFAALFAQTPDTAFVTAAAALYQPKVNKAGVAISATAPLPLFRKADNKIQWVKSLMQGQIDNIDAVLPLKLNTSDAATTYATITKVDTGKANIRSEMSNNISNVVVNTEAVYAKKTDITTAASNYFYVDRRWTGARGGTSWTAQNSAATKGSIAFPYPDLWAARNAAVTALKAGTSESVIYVFGGNSFSFSNVVDGSNDYESATFEAKRYDTYNSDSTSTNTVSLLYNKLNYYFEQGTTLVHNGQSGITVPFCDAATSIESSIRGFLTYKANYGQGQGKNTQSILARGVNSKILIDLYKWDSKAGWNENYVKSKEFTFNAEVVYRVTGGIFSFYGANGGNYKINIGTFLQGKYAGSGYQVGDCWAIFHIGGVSGKFKNSSLDIDIKQASVEEDCDGLIYAQSIDTSIVNIKIGSLVQSARSGAQASSGYIVNAQGDTWNSSTVTLGINVMNGDMGVAAILSTQNKSHVVIDCKECEVNNPSATSRSAFRFAATLDSISSFVNTGVYRSVSNPIIELASTSFKAMLSGSYKTTSSSGAISLTQSAPNVLLNGQIYSSGTNSITATSANSYITILPSATANKAVSSNVITQGATLNVNSLFKF